MPSLVGGSHVYGRAAHGDAPQLVRLRDRGLQAAGKLTGAPGRTTSSCRVRVARLPYARGALVQEYAKNWA